MSNKKSLSYKIARKLIKSDEYGKLIFWGAYVYAKPVQTWPKKELTTMSLLILIFEGVLILLTMLCMVLYIYGNLDNFNKYSYAICVFNIPFAGCIKLIYTLCSYKKLRYLLDEVMEKFWPEKVITGGSAFFIDCFKMHNISLSSFFILGNSYCLIAELTTFFMKEKNFIFPTRVPALFPYNITESPTYEIVNILQAYALNMSHFMVCGTDMLVYAILITISQQYYILQTCFSALNSEEVHEINKKLRPICRDKFEEKYDWNRELLYRCVRHHQMLLKFMKELNVILNLFEITQLIVAIIAICFGILRLTNREEMTYIDLLNSGLYVMCFLSQLTFDCYLGSYIHYQGALLPNALFHSDWKNVDLKLQNDIMFVLLHTQRIPVFSIYGLFDINMGSFVRVIKVAFSFYTMLSSVGR